MKSRPMLAFDRETTVAAVMASAGVCGAEAVESPAVGRVIVTSAFGAGAHAANENNAKTERYRMVRQPCCNG
jgi:hypothetical protein